jgi:hypothetical protein
VATAKASDKLANGMAFAILSLGVANITNFKNRQPMRRIIINYFPVITF